MPFLQGTHTRVQTSPRASLHVSCRASIADNHTVLQEASKQNNDSTDNNDKDAVLARRH